MADMQIVPAVAASFRTNVEAQYVEMMVPLYSYGCERKIKKSLSRLRGIYSVNVDYSQQKVTVWGICNKYDVLETMRRKRKDARFWNPVDNVIMPAQEEEAPEKPPPQLVKVDNPKISRQLLLLTKAGRSLSSWKAWKKLVVFNRSSSF
ncbi:hypothetical protein SAY87_030782 [Trapa incisa]|uniref:HMA domain-containing protein n=1 Tax=Trapa incisa TaxID=236973 RepID=A0AAN7KP17_9MYRT|nr:hypothetical protein SAY87_030782 [Trapa incisa]